ncbi:MAG: hypothetical protein HOY79_07535 [Streptomyces sp.]|nr:hypothetical protein [Streptomyces sp.]NUS10432.1 hypothetical protein [Streptomyces sp.]
MSTSTQSRSNTAAPHNEQASLAAGRAAGYCWVKNPHGRGRCTKPPHTGGGHKDVYAHTTW